MCGQCLKCKNAVRWFLIMEITFAVRHSRMVKRMPSTFLVLFMPISARFFVKAKDHFGGLHYPVIKKISIVLIAQFLKHSRKMKGWHDGFVWQKNGLNFKACLRAFAGLVMVNVLNLVNGLIN